MFCLFPGPVSAKLGNLSGRPSRQGFAFRRFPSVSATKFPASVGVVATPIDAGNFGFAFCRFPRRFAPFDSHPTTRTIADFSIVDNNINIPPLQMMKQDPDGKYTDRADFKMVNLRQTQHDRREQGLQMHVKGVLVPVTSDVEEEDTRGREISREVTNDTSDDNGRDTDSD